MGDARGERLNVRIDGATQSRLDAVCKEHGVSRSALARIALLTYLEGASSETESIAATLSRMDAKLEKVASNVARLASNGRIAAELTDAVLKIVLFRTIAPDDGDGAAKAKASVDYQRIVSAVAVALREGRGVADAEEPSAD